MSRCFSQSNLFDTSKRYAHISVVHIANGNRISAQMEPDQEINFFELLRELQNRYSELEDRVKLLELRKETPSGMENTDREQQTQTVRIQRTKGRVVSGLVERVTLVGLKEAITLPRRSLQVIWTVLLFLGLIATAYYICNTTIEYLGNPTATSIQLEHLPKYEYPSLILCTGSWLDAPKALAKGLTKDALKYSIAYLDQFVTQGNRNLDVTKAKTEFENFYIKNNYSSLLDYFRDIAVDMPELDSHAALSEYDGPAHSCGGCNDDIPVEKVIIDDLLCYAFTFTPADGKHVEILGARPHIYIQTKDKAAGISQVSPNWRAYLSDDTHILHPSFPSIAVEPFESTTLKTSAQKFKLLKNDDPKCLDSSEVSDDYFSAERCRLKCLHKILRRKVGCDIFSYSAYDNPSRPQEYCNYFGSVPGLNMTFSEYMKSNATMQSELKESNICIQSCPYPCERTVYTSSLDSKFTIHVDSFNISKNARQHNMSFAMVQLENTAMSQGGVLTLSEVSTFSFSTLVSNVGGTLGLFIGGTIMTFFQIILWIVDHLLEALERKRIIAVGNNTKS